MTIAAWLVCAFAVLMDAVLLVLMQGLSLSAELLSALALAHAALCLLFAMVLLRLLPEPLRQPTWAARGFVFLGVVFIPVLGMGGFLAFVVPALNRHGLRDQPSGWQHSDVPMLPDKPAALHHGALSRASDLAGPLLHAADPRKRIAALIATLSLPSRQAVPLLRLALKDGDDEVRLLAYALLNRKEKAVESRMRGRQGPASASAGPELLFLQHRALAHDYWELAHLGDPQGEALLSLCGRAHEHVQAALQLRPHEGGLHFLCGQILLVQMQLAQASDAFEQARQCGIDARQVCAMQAEIAFKGQRYGDVRHHLTRMGSGGHHPALSKLSSYWAGARA